MFSIYFNNRRLSVCSNTDQIIKDPEAVLYKPGSTSDLEGIPMLFDQTPNISRMYIPSENEETTFNQLFSSLTHINAGGGLVTNSKGDFLMIFRHGKWDLPKGTQEPNEDIRCAAVREVEEECGIDKVVIKKHICDTYHTYHRNSLFWLKRTSWYKMEYTGNGTQTVPQIEEDIEKAIWVKREELGGYLENTYPSIIEVFRLSETV
jgi:ADP-ribose pyrophosphatase YjhB (NUDIX family)